MIIDDHDISGIAVLPDKTDAPLIVDANAVLTCAVAFQRFQAVRRGYAQIFQRFGIVEHTQLALGNMLEVSRQLARHIAQLDLLALLVRKLLIMYRDTIAKQ